MYVHVEIDIDEKHLADTLEANFFTRGKGVNECTAYDLAETAR